MEYKELTPGDVLVLEGKTRKGKNRIREQGNQWRIMRVKETVQFSNARGPWLLVCPDNQAHDKELRSRWIHGIDDEDFAIRKGT